MKRCLLCDKTDAGNLELSVLIVRSNKLRGLDKEGRKETGRLQWDRVIVILLETLPNALFIPAVMPFITRSRS